MSDKQMKRLFAEYNQRTEVPEKFRSPKRGLSRGSRLKWVTSSAFVLAATAAVVLWPKPTLASRFELIDHAITNAWSMKSTAIQHRSSGDRVTRTTAYYRGKWRLDGFLGTNLENTWIHSDGKAAIWFKRDDFATIGEPYGSFNDVPRKALDYVLENTNYGSVSEERKISLGDTEVWQGREVYKILATRSNGIYNAEIIVDQATNLPIRADYEYTVDGRTERYSREYEWNREFDEDFFDASSFPVALIDRDAELQQVAEEWREPITTVEFGDASSQLRNIFVSETGVVFLAYTIHENEEGRAPIPASITDDQGNVYGRTLEYAPGGLYGDTLSSTKQIAYGGGVPRFSVFVPADPGPIAAEINIGWQMGRPTWPASSDNDPEFSGETAHTVLAAPRTADQEFPDYSAALVLDRYHWQKRIEIARTRSELLFQEGQLKEAVKWGWIAYSRYGDHIPRIGFRELPLVYDALEAAGKLEEAEQVRARYEKEKLFDEEYTRG
jgi:hypothetical protein